MTLLTHLFKHLRCRMYFLATPHVVTDKQTDGRTERRQYYADRTERSTTN